MGCKTKVDFDYHNFNSSILGATIPIIKLEIDPLIEFHQT